LLQLTEQLDVVNTRVKMGDMNDPLPSVTEGV